MASPERPAVDPADSLAIDVRGLTKAYGHVRAVQGVDLQVRAGEIFALLGPNGAGKTTTVEILEGYRPRDGGTAKVLGYDPGRQRQRLKSRIGIVLQSSGVDRYLTVAETIAMYSSYYPNPQPVDEVIGLVGLGEKRDARVIKLSGGQQRRLDVAIGIVGRPELLFLDEPTAGFDPEARRDFHDVVHRLTDREKTTILLTTHDLDEAERLADRILILAGGTIIADGSADELGRAMSGQSEVRWSRDGQRFVRAADDATAFVRELFRQYGESVEDLEVHRASLEDTYMALVRQAEHGVPRRLTAVAA